MLETIVMGEDWWKLPEIRRVLFWGCMCSYCVTWMWSYCSLDRMFLFKFEIFFWIFNMYWGMRGTFFSHLLFKAYALLNKQTHQYYILDIHTNQLKVTLNTWRKGGTKLHYIKDIHTNTDLKNTLCSLLHYGITFWTYTLTNGHTRSYEKLLYRYKEKICISMLFTSQNRYW